MHSGKYRLINQTFENRTGQASSVHTLELIHNCQICDKTFKRASTLRSHKLLHTRERRFACQICDKNFTQASHLHSHTLIHTKERRFICQVCDKRFKTASNLRSHELIHTGERRFTCQICDKIFKTTSNLHRHVRHQHNKRDEHTDMRYVHQITCPVHVCCECHLWFDLRFNTPILPRDIC